MLLVARRLIRLGHAVSKRNPLIPIRVWLPALCHATRKINNTIAVIENTETAGAATDVDRAVDIVKLDELAIAMGPRPDATATKFDRFGLHDKALALPKQLTPAKNGATLRKKVLPDGLVLA